MTILHIDSSILGDNSVSRALSAEVAEREAALTRGTIVRRDLAAEPLSHLSGASFAWRALDAAADPLPAAARALLPPPPPAVSC